MNEFDPAMKLRHITDKKWTAAYNLNIKRFAEQEKDADMEVMLVGRVFPSGDVFKLEKIEPTGLPCCGNDV